MGERETVLMRTREDSRLALRLFAAELMAKTGKQYYDADALEEFVRKYRPDLYERAVAMVADSDTQDQTENEN